MAATSLVAEQVPQEQDYMGKLYLEKIFIVNYVTVLITLYCVAITVGG